MDYGYCLRMLDAMEDRKWLKSFINSFGKRVFRLTGKANLRLVRNIMEEKDPEQTTIYDAVRDGVA
jgi:hypothetical protein